MFAVLPVAGTGGQQFSRLPAVAVRDLGGNTVTSLVSTRVTLEMVDGPGSLVGTTSVITETGVADFTGTGLSLDVAGVYALRVTSGTPQFTSDTVNVVVEGKNKPSL